jgi:hypothetical protein
MSFVPTPDQSGVQTALRSFLLAVLPAGVDILEGQDNRSPEPSGSDFVIFTTLRRPRLGTNIDSVKDVKFTGSIAGTVMTVTAVTRGVISAGAKVFGVGVAANTVISAQTSGTPPGGIGTYTVAPTQAVSSETLSCGAKSLIQPTEICIQLDFHSADVGDSADMAQTVSTLFRDEFSTRQFADQIPNYGVTPLSADDPKQIPFINENQQYETRWVVEAMLQSNGLLSVSQEFADSAVVKTVDVDAAYPPT